MARYFTTSKDTELIMFGKEFCKIRTTAYFDGDDHVNEIVVNKEGKKVISWMALKSKKHLSF